MLNVFITVICSVIYNKYEFDVFNGQASLFLNIIIETCKYITSYFHIAATFLVDSFFSQLYTQHKHSWPENVPQIIANPTEFSFKISEQ